jgi:Zn-dependent protease
VASQPRDTSGIPGAALKVGEIWGIKIGIHPSWLIVFALITWALAGGQLPAEYPGWTAMAYWRLAIVTSVLFFTSIVIHELGHARVALAHGLPIAGITLFVFGGVASMTREPKTPRVEFRVAAAGPATSLLLAALFAAVSALMSDVVVIAASASWLARINFALALFNLVPAFPLDGGRVFRALVWSWTGSLERATAISGFAGQFVASALIALGIFMALSDNVVSGVWMALIGWFLHHAAATSQAQATVKGLLRGVSVAHAMTRECPRVGREWTLERLVREEVLGAGRRCFFVTDNGHLHGLLTVHELKAVPRDQWGELTVGDVLTPLEKLTVVTPDDDLAVALEKMNDARVAQVPVVEGRTLVGMVGREQILHYLTVRSELGV